MLRLGRALFLVVLCLLVAFPAPVLAGDGLRAPTIAASVAAAADWATTYHALKLYRVREVNPILRPMDRTPGPMISVGAVIDASLVSTWNLTMAAKHERAAAAGLWAMAAFRGYLAIHNLRNERKSVRR